MLANIIRKVLFGIAGIFLLSIISFILLQHIPGDPVLAKMQMQGIRQPSKTALFQSAEYHKIRRKMGLDLPVFYFSICPLSISDSLSSIPNREIQRAMRNIAVKHGSDKDVIRWHEINMHLVKLQQANLQKTEEIELINAIMISDDLDQNQAYYQNLMAFAETKEEAALYQSGLLQMLKINENATPLQSYIPVVNWHGHSNRFHRWFFGTEEPGSGVIKGNLGESFRDSRPVSTTLFPAFRITLLLAFITIILIYTVSLPLGIKMARPDSSKFGYRMVNIIFALYAMPSFWIAMMMLTFLCSPEFLNWFPAAYNLMQIDPNSPLLMRWFYTLWHLILPVTCWALAGTAFLTLQTHQKSTQLYGSDFIGTARAKGLTESQIAKKHIFRNAALPAVSLLGSIIPAALSGAIVIELIFSIPGMGSLIFSAMHTRDYPVVMAVMLIIGTAALIGSGLSDLLLMLLDPRIRAAKIENE
jgi:peptide/nickel transport system permease protein